MEQRFRSGRRYRFRGTGSTHLRADCSVVKSELSKPEFIIFDFKDNRPKRFLKKRFSLDQLPHYALAAFQLGDGFQ